jgi:maltose alpha-D-glucosyltransferase/alpha-amylase
MPDWLKDAVFYEIYPQSYYDTNGDGIGDINGIAEKLDYVKWLGCNAIWINPCFDSPFCDAGYDVRDYKKVAPRYGTNSDLYRLFEKAHKKGIRILLDLVPGHTSEEHPWFRESCRTEKNEYTNRYIWTDSVWNYPPSYHFISGRAERSGNYLVNFFSMQPALNYGFRKVTADWQLPCDHPDCAATREAMKDVMRFWLNKGCDGFRVDMADSLVKNDDRKKSGTGAIWKDVREMLDREYPEAALVSEWSNPELSLGYGFHCDFYLNHEGNGYYSLFRDINRESGRQHSYFSSQGHGDIMKFLDDYLPKYDKTKQEGYISFITCNHDTPRMSRDFTEREMKLAYSFLFTMPGVPFLYYGDEIGMRYLGQLKNKEGGYERTGSRTPMQWNGSQDNAGFSEAPADRLYLPVDASGDAPSVNSQSDRKDSLLNTVRDVIRLRHENTCLHADGPFEVVYAQHSKYPFLFRRGNFLFAINPSGKAAEAPIRVKGTVAFSVGEKPVLGEKSIRMAPQSFVAVKHD